MKFTLNWLKEHLETNATLEEISYKLTMLGLEVEGIENPAQMYKDYIIGEIRSANKHPDADKLQLLSVFDGEKEHQVVCGAPNARAGLKGVFGREGVYVPGGDFKLKKGKIRGVESCGMMMSERELCISDEHDGIIEFSSDNEFAIVGNNPVKALGLDDAVIEIAITPNRGDCCGVRYIARDLASAGLGTLKPLKTISYDGTGFQSPIKTALNLKDDNSTHSKLLIGAYIKDVANKQSPEWLQKRLKAIGLRPISALVDITNYFTFDLCRPLHTYDADKIQGNILQIRMASENESFTGVADDKDYTLSQDTLVVADNNQALAIAGVMGGKDSGINEQTKNVFLEVAVFNPVTVALAGRKYNIQSDSRFRFERGIDEQASLEYAKHAVQMILNICGGEASALEIATSQSTYDETFKVPPMAFNPKKVKSLTSINIALKEQKIYLERVGCIVDDSQDIWQVIRPSWRYDIYTQACLVEEILRLHGYDKVEILELPKNDYLPKQVTTSEQERRFRLTRSLASHGLQEAVTFSFLSEKEAKLFGGNNPNLILSNPISEDLKVMRPTLIPNLVSALSRNLAKGLNGGALFEVGPQFQGVKPEDQPVVVGGVRAGVSLNRSWNHTGRQADVFDVKADVYKALESINAPVANLQTITETPTYYHPTRSGALVLGRNTLAYFGELHPAVLKDMGFKGRMVAFEIFLDKIPVAKNKGTSKPYLDIPQLQSLKRDFAFVVDKNIQAEKLLRAVKGADKKLITDVTLFDIYEGTGLEDNQKSLGLTISIQPLSKTLTNEEIENISQKVIAQAEKTCNAFLRV